MRIAFSLHFCRLRPNQFEKEQAWLEEDQAQPETWSPIESMRYAEINPGLPKLRYLWMSSKPILSKRLLLLLFPTSLLSVTSACSRVHQITNQARYVTRSRTPRWTWCVGLPPAKLIPPHR